MKRLFLLAFLLIPFMGFAQFAQDDEKGRVYLTAFTAFDNFNGGSVANTPSNATTISLGQASRITSIQTYHWNYGRGTTNPGSIKLIKSDGTVYGPWTATGLAGSGGVPNAFWIIYPNVDLAPGTYTIADSDNATWSCNTQSLKKGFAKVAAKR